MQVNEIELKKLQNQLYLVFLKAIDEIGIDEFKKCSFFGRNKCK